MFYQFKIIKKGIKLSTAIEPKPALFDLTAILYIYEA